MAILANIGGLYVRQAFAGGFHTIMAAETATGDAGMVEYGGSPGGGLVAVIALLTTGEMGWIFSRGNDAIVTGSTTARDSRVVHIGDRAPGRCRMTVGTEVCRRNMIGRFNGGTAKTNSGMTGNAVRIGSFERAAGMASLTTNVGMCSVETESGAEMIERFLRQQAGWDQNESQNKLTSKESCSSKRSRQDGCIDCHLIILTSRKVSAEWQRPQS
jgi:hypothetical protein